jgi:Heterokaryon incompatibility protein (HET)
MTFSYTPLNPSRRQIRLIEINNGISTGAPMYPSPAVVCTMKNFDFDDCPRYRALSYAWGSQHPRTQLYINEQPASVSQGLGTFLERARHLDWLLTPGYIWIDQVCIDQSKIEERNNQVSFMGEIYQKATEVLVWLGPAAEGSTQAITAILSLDFREIEKNQHGLRSLFRRPYWTRLWAVQEILLSRGGKILCGKS